MFESLGWYIAALALFIWYLSLQAGRLDRLHHRIEIAQAALDGHLTRRAGIAAELVALNFLDPASEAQIVQSAHDVLTGPDLPVGNRIEDEAELTRSLAEVFNEPTVVAEFRKDPAVSQLLDELVAVIHRIALARRFYTEAIADCQNIRGQIVVRLFRLAGRAPLPQAVDLVDELPAGLDDST
jgi:hypothetical protein